MVRATNFLASLIVLSLLPVRSRHESLLLVFWLLILPPAARNWDPKPPFPPSNLCRSWSEISCEPPSCGNDEIGVVVDGTKLEVGRNSKSRGFGSSGYFSAKRSYRSSNGVSEGADKQSVENGENVETRMVAGCDMVVVAERGEVTLLRVWHTSHRYSRSCTNT